MVFDHKLLKDATISFKFYRRINHHNILVKFELEVILKLLDEFWPIFDLGLG